MNKRSRFLPLGLLTCALLTGQLALAADDAAGAPPDTFGAAQALVAAHRVPEAVPLLIELVATEPDNHAARLLLGQCHLKMARHDLARPLLAEGLRRTGPTPPHALLAAHGQACLETALSMSYPPRARHYLELGVTDLERAVVLAPDEPSYREALILFYRGAPENAGGDEAKAAEHAHHLARIRAQATPPPSGAPPQS
jgi:tetratricopeptide (TPR) repeat protein